MADYSWMDNAQDALAENDAFLESIFGSLHPTDEACSVKSVCTKYDDSCSEPSCACYGDRCQAWATPCGDPTCPGCDGI